jgi:hypothetical protein
MLIDILVNCQLSALLAAMAIYDVFLFRFESGSDLTLEEILLLQTSFESDWRFDGFDGIEFDDTEHEGVVRFVLGPISQWGISKGPWPMDKKHLPTTDHPVRVQATLT